MQNNNKCLVCNDKYEMVRHIKCNSNKLAQKEYNSRHDWVGKVIYSLSNIKD